MKPIQKLFIIIIIPILFLLTIEGIFWLIDFEYYPIDSGLIVPAEYKMFQEKGEGYTDQKNQFFLKDKPNKEKRIFFLGGSSVQMLGECKYLREELEYYNSDYDFNIVNAGYASWGTDRVLLLFHEILDYDPDLIILYSGHNEFEEEYLRKIFSKDTRLLELNNKLLNISRFYQFYSMSLRRLMEFVARKNVEAIRKNQHPLFPKDVELGWSGKYNKDEIYANYESNVTQMIKMSKTRKIPIIISTVAYNRLIPPNNAISDNYKICSKYLREKNFTVLKTCLEKALDEDLQPHRATTTSNQIIRNLAKTYHLPLADIDAVIVNHSDKGIPGNNIFVDYCHLKPRGNYLLLEALFELIMGEALLP